MTALPASRLRFDVSEPVPSCPVTAEPAKRLVQWVSAGLLARLWQVEFGVDVRPSFGGVRRFGLWESPTGLYFFDPPREGDRGFYETFYKHRGMKRYLRDSDRGEFRLAAGYVRPGDRVLDVGCGLGAFRAHVPHAQYTGLDPNLTQSAQTEWARAEMLAAHLDRHAGSYDVACAFQVVEHVSNPVALVTEMGLADRPGGTVIIGVPHVPSAQTRIPNLLNNAVPHHLTWWTPAALEALAARAGLVNARVQPSPWSRTDSFIWWMARHSPVQCKDVHYRHSWLWHGATLVAVLGALAAWGRPVPAEADREGVALLLVAERPEGAA